MVSLIKRWLHQYSVRGIRDGFGESGKACGQCYGSAFMVLKPQINKVPSLNRWRYNVTPAGLCKL